jgi:hypothetical protein
LKFLIDGHSSRVDARIAQWPEGVAGQLLTPLTRYKLRDHAFAIDNGAFSGFNQREFTNLLRRVKHRREDALFVCVPDIVGDHRGTMSKFRDLHHLADGWRKAFVAQDGFDGMPEEATALFIGGTDKFKDSQECYGIVRRYKHLGFHVHVGRVNGPDRFLVVWALGAHTCDGSGVSRYDHMLPAIKRAMET